MNTKDRTRAFTSLAKFGVSYGDSARLLRLGATLHRLAEALCDGAYPYNGDRDEPNPATVVEKIRWQARYRRCESCQTLTRLYALRKTRGYLCPDCCATEDAHKLAKSLGLIAQVQGDPRGAVLLVYPGDTSPEDIENGRARGEAVCCG